MFGDSGHGCIMLIFAAWMCIWEKSLGAKKSNNEIWNIFFAGRYIVLLMGMFSVYTGFIYNDVFSKSVNIFQSSWKPAYNACTIINNKDLQLSPLHDYTQTPYIIGMDPVWQVINEFRLRRFTKININILFWILGSFKQNYLFEFVQNEVIYYLWRTPYDIWCVYECR
jgi:V-type H+-transporting ATPase subunit a